MKKCMAITLSLMCVVALSAQLALPPAFPRTNATKLLDTDRITVWDIVWPKGQPTALHRHPYAMTGVYYASGDRMITAVDGSTRPETTKAGGIVSSDEPLRAVMVELKGDYHDDSSGSAGT